MQAFMDAENVKNNVRVQYYREVSLVKPKIPKR